MITKDNFPQALQVDLEIKFDEGRQASASNEYKQLILIEPTTSNAKRHVFYGGKGRLRRFRGERQPQIFFEYDAMLQLDDWEYTSTVKRTVLDDDQSGGKLKSLVRNFGSVAEVSKEREFWEFLHNGTSLNGFDGENLFDFNHVYTDTKGNNHGITQSNMHLGGSQLDATTLQLEQEAFATLQDDQGNVYGGRLTHVAVKRGSKNAKKARELSNSQYTVETTNQTFTENVFKGAFGLIEFDYGFGSSEWLSFDLSDPGARPVIALSHTISPGFENMEYTQLLQDSETGFWRNEFAFGLWGRWGYNVGDWRTARLNGSSGYTFTPTDYERQELPDIN